MKMEETECCKMSANKIQTPGNYPEESTQHPQQGESLKSRKRILSLQFSSKTWDPPTQLHLSLHLPPYPLGCCIDDEVGIFLLKMLPLLPSSKNTTWLNMLHILPDILKRNSKD